MKLDQKQMHIVSQLFMAASKAGHSFDLKSFTTNSAYASDTLEALALHADRSGQAPLHSLVAITADMLASLPPASKLESSTSQPELAAQPEPSAEPTSAKTATTQKYIGQLR
jgi:hypothetical protein